MNSETSMTLRDPHAVAHATGSLAITAIQLVGSTTQSFSYHAPAVSRMHVSQYSEAKAMAGTGSWEFSGISTVPRAPKIALLC